MENTIIIDSKKPLIKNLKKTIYQSNNTDNYIGIPNECSICYKKLNKNDEKIILINNLCKCYIKVCICTECLITWENTNKKQCFICRSKYEQNVYYTDNLKFKQKLRDNNIFIKIINNKQNYKIKTKKNLKYISKKAYKNKCKICFYIFLVNFFFISIISVLKTIQYQNDTNSTVLIW